MGDGVVQVARDPQAILGDTAGCLGLACLLRLNGAVGEFFDVAATDPARSNELPERVLLCAHPELSTVLRDDAWQRRTLTVRQELPEYSMHV